MSKTVARTLFYMKLRYKHFIKSFDEKLVEKSLEWKAADEATRKKIEHVASKLISLETEIVNDPKGIITIIESDKILVESFESSLGVKISEILTNSGLKNDILK